LSVSPRARIPESSAALPPPRGDPDKPSILNTDTNVTPPSQVVSDTLLPAEQYSPCPQAVMGLSYNWTGMSTLVNNMVAGGNTNQAVGLQLGWLSLVGGGPFTAPAMDPNYKYQQVIILLTDGLNTQDRWYTDQRSIDDRASKPRPAGATVTAGWGWPGTRSEAPASRPGNVPRLSLVTM